MANQSSVVVIWDTMKLANTSLPLTITPPGLYKWGGQKGWESLLLSV